MKRTLFQSIVKESIQEGGNAIPGAGPIRGDLAGEIAHDVINSVSKAFSCNAEMAGSTGKKGREMTSGDVDILMDMSWDRSKEVVEWIRQSFPTSHVEVSEGFREVSFGYPYTVDGEEKTAQVDLMFTSNLEWRRASVYSPSPYESKFKGLVREILMKLITIYKPVDIEEYPTEYYTAEDYGGGYEGQKKSWWRYLWDGERGLLIVRRSTEGKKRPIQAYNADSRLITKNLNAGLKEILGPGATFDDIKSPETIVKYLFSGKYPYGGEETLQKIHDSVLQNKSIAGLPGAAENFEALWGEYVEREEQQRKPAYSQAIQEIHDLNNRLKNIC
jgi:hypothetical protein